MHGVGRLTLSLARGQRAFVVADLDLTPQTAPHAIGVEEFIAHLNELDEASVTVIAGNAFDLRGADDPAAAIAETFERLTNLVAAIRRYGSQAYRRLVLIPGAHDRALLTSEFALQALGAVGIEIATDVVLRIATPDGDRDMVVAAADPATPTAAGDAACLERPTDGRRFAFSRLLYRQLGRWLWLPLAGMVALDVGSSIATAVGDLSHHRLHLHSARPADVFADVLDNLLILVAFELLVAVIATVLVRWRLRHESQLAPADPLALAKVGDVDALTLARSVAEHGGLGAVVGGASGPSLAFLGAGVCATPGPSRRVVIERRGRLGLPPVFAPVDRFGIVEVETSTAARLTLLGRERPLPMATKMERLFAGPARWPHPSAATNALGRWPGGEPYPVGTARLRDFDRQRRTRRAGALSLIITGVADVAFSAFPPLRGRLHEVERLLPLGFVQGATAIMALAGVALIMLARGVRRGQRRAWLAAVVLLFVTIGTHLARGGSVRDTILALIALAILLFGRERFTAGGDHVGARTVLPVLGLVAVGAVGAATASFELVRHPAGSLPSLPEVALGCAERLIGVSWINLPDRVSDFANPALLAIGAGLIVIALYVVTRPVVDRQLSERTSPASRRVADLRARDLVRRHGRGTLDYFALRDDKQFFFHRDGVVAYAVYGGVALMSPDPIGPVTERAELLGAFRDFVQAQGWTMGVMGASNEWLPMYHASGLHSIYLGDEAVVDCPSFSLAGGRMKGLRQACSRIERHGYTVEFHDPAHLDPARIDGVVELISQLRRGEGERGFSMMLGRLFDPRDEGLLLTLVVAPDGRPAAVCQFVPSPEIHGFSLDLMRRDPGAHPNGLLDAALCATIQYLGAHGGRGLSLNFAAFRSVLEEDAGDTAVTRVERWALRRLSGVLPIETLYNFNAKYHPSWLPRYLVYPDAESLVPVVAATLRAEAITELPVIGRLFAGDPSQRTAAMVPADVRDRAKRAAAR